MKKTVSFDFSLELTVEVEYIFDEEDGTIDSFDITGVSIKGYKPGTSIMLLMGNDGWETLKEKSFYWATYKGE